MHFIKVWLPGLIRVNAETAQLKAVPFSWCPWEQDLRQLLKRGKPRWGLLSPMGVAFLLNTCCLGSAWSTAPTTLQLHQGFCSYRPRPQPMGYLPPWHQPHSYCSGLGMSQTPATAMLLARVWDRLWLPLGSPQCSQSMVLSTWHSNENCLPFTLYFLPY